MTDDKTLLSRRTVLKGSGASLGAAAVGVGGLVYSSQPALASEATINADEQIISDDVNNITDVSISPVLEVEWSNFSQGVDSIDITVTADVEDGGDGQVLTQSLTESPDGDDDSDFSATDGSITIDLAQQSLIGNVAEIEQADFPQEVTDGNEESVNVVLTFDFTANGSGNDATATDTPDFDVGINNPDADGNFAEGSDSETSADAE